MAKYCPECGNHTYVKMLAYLLPFRVCVACANMGGFFSYPYKILLAPVEALFGKGIVLVMGYDEDVSYFRAAKIYLFGGNK